MKASFVALLAASLMAVVVGASQSQNFTPVMELLKSRGAGRLIEATTVSLPPI